MRESGSCCGDVGVSGGGVPLGDGVVIHPSFCGAKIGLCSNLCVQLRGPHGVHHDINLT